MYTYLVHHRLICAILAFILLCVDMAVSGRSRSRALVFLTLAGLCNAFVFHVFHCDPVPSNFSHYYLGSKFVLPNEELYRLVAAGRDELPFFESDRRRRFAALELLGGPFRPDLRPDATTAELEETCRREGRFRELLVGFFGDREESPARIEEFRRDCQASFIQFQDAGFNASPWYILVRNLDPTLHLPLSRGAFFFSLLAQVIGLWVCIRLVAKALDFDHEEEMLAGALFLCCWDYSGWTLSGLVGAGWFLPVCATLFGYRRRLAFLTGLGVAWGTCVKLFPFVLLVPALMVALPSPGGAPAAAESPERRFGARTVIWTLFLTAIMVAVSEPIGNSWMGFLGKITDLRPGVNCYGLTQVFLSFGYAGVGTTFQLAVMAAVVAAIVFFGLPRDGSGQNRLPLAALFCITSTGWLAWSWLSYYCLVLLPALVVLRRSSPACFRIFLGGMVLNQALPDYAALGDVSSGITTIVFLKGIGFTVLPFALWAVFLKDVERPAVRRGLAGVFGNRPDSWGKRNRPSGADPGRCGSYGGGAGGCPGRPGRSGCRPCPLSGMESPASPGAFLERAHAGKDRPAEGG